MILKYDSKFQPLFIREEILYIRYSSIPLNPKKSTIRIASFYKKEILRVFKISFDDEFIK